MIGKLACSRRASPRRRRSRRAQPGARLPRCVGIWACLTSSSRPRATTQSGRTSNSAQREILERRRSKDKRSAYMQKVEAGRRKRDAEVNMWKFQQDKTQDPLIGWKKLREQGKIKDLKREEAPEGGSRCRWRRSTSQSTMRAGASTCACRTSIRGGSTRTRTSWGARGQEEEGPREERPQESDPSRKSPQYSGGSRTLTVASDPCSGGAVLAQ